MIPESYLEDASGYRGEADAIFTPASAEEVTDLISRAVDFRTPITVSGAGTGVTGGRVPHGGWILSLEKFQRLDTGDGVAWAGAGVRLGDLHAAARARGQFYPPDPTEITASVGGTLATNASGSRTFRYGPTRAHVRALQVARMDGSVRWYRRGDKVGLPYVPLPVPRTTKHAAGLYLRENLDWVDLFIGSEGTLGIILEAELSLMPQPAQLLSGVVFFPADDLALDAVEAWRDLAGLRMLEYFDANSLRMLRGRFPEIPASASAALAVEDDAPEALDRWVGLLEQSGALEQSWFGEEAADRERFRIFRHTLPELVNDVMRGRGLRKIGTDFAVPLPQTRRIMNAYREALSARPSLEAVIFGHLGDAHVHVNLMPAAEAEVPDSVRLVEDWARLAVSLGGTVSAEHGLGKRKAWMLALEFSPDEISRMTSVKRLLDPLDLLGAGTLLPPK